MRSRITAVLMISAIIFLLSIQSIHGRQIVAKRVIEVNDYGLVYIYDEVPRAGDITEIRFPRKDVVNLVNFRSPEDPSPELAVGEKTFSIVIHSKGGDVVHLTTIFRDVIRWDSTNRRFTLRIGLNPILKMKTNRFSVVIRLPPDARVEEASPKFISDKGKGVLEGETSTIDLTSETPQLLSIRFGSGTLRLLDITEVKASYMVSGGDVEVYMKIRNGGGEDLSGLTLRIPAKSGEVEAEDGLGRLAADYNSEKGVVKLSLRQGIRFREYGSVKIHFKLPSENPYIHVDGKEIDARPILPINMTVRRYDLRIILTSMNFEGSDPEPIELRRTYPETITLSYRFDHVDPFNAEDFKILIRYAPSLGRFRIMPYLWAIGIVAVVIGAVTSIYLKRGKAPERLEPSLRRFMETADMLTASYQELASLISTGRILEKGYVRPRILELRGRIRRYGDKLSSTAMELMKKTPELREDLTKVNDAVKGLKRAVESLWVATHRYLSGALSRSAFKRQVDRRFRILKREYSRFAEVVENIREKAG